MSTRFEECRLIRLAKGCFCNESFYGIKRIRHKATLYPILYGVRDRLSTSLHKLSKYNQFLYILGAFTQR